MPDLHVEFCSGKCPGKNRIGISLDKNHIGFFVLEDFFYSQHYLPRLFGMAP